MEKMLCDERHKRIDEKLDVAERRLNNHSERIDRIEQVNSRMEERLNGLIEQLGTLNTTLKWFMGILVGSFVSFFFYAVQQGIFK
ncbi:hemolysin XhlA family protein [Anaerosolibacter sp.]|uniref:hemolysin XhlA family protein n=1 Tax=Anaerosolibacter sp. TaxID=1872527 RepID=UPI0039EE9E32